MYKKFKKLLEEKNITPYELSQKTGISPSTFSDWKAGRYTPKIDKIKIIADFFDVPVDYFLEKERSE